MEGDSNGLWWPTPNRLCVCSFIGLYDMSCVLACAGLVAWYRTALFPALFSQVYGFYMKRVQFFSDLWKYSRWFFYFICCGFVWWFKKKYLRLKFFSVFSSVRRNLSFIFSHYCLGLAWWVIPLEMSVYTLYSLRAQMTSVRT